MKRIMYVGGGWGNVINMWGNDNLRIFGFKPQWERFSEGSVLFDLAHNLMEDTIPLYYIYDVDWQNDPRDMFFAKIDLIGRIENLYKYHKDMFWFVQPCRILLYNLREKRSKLPWYKFSKRRKLKKYINTVEEMIKP